MTDANVALLIRMEAQSGKESDVEEFLRSALPLAEDEPDTTTWFALRMGESTFGIFDTFPDESGREAHLSGEIAGALEENADELLAEPPQIEEVEVLEAKLP
ncbi:MULTISPECIES: putative quinol monooxygenase [Halococcaceae]|jgi:quinol monooxygenase YgiN|uniref:Antibiotic biosynthesis monooxygenase n=1 Tax=Halococcus salifodinae DSM 8989 TaxID=1227456 RepID=M0NBR6_9EURY|nr:MULTISPECIES: hypothetical protein [Halococcaceae]EMA54519.1 hypothetical protein C450_05660 [Halococcus salifodinae DSM 8989]